MRLLTVLLGSLLLCSCGGDKYFVTFHMETDSSDSQKFAFPHDGHFYEKAPFISQRDFESYYSFPGENNTYGVVFFVNKPQIARVEGETASNLGKQILPMVNGHMLSPIKLNRRPISDGRIGVFGGFSPADLKELSEHISPKDAKREEPVLALASQTKKLLSADDPNLAKKEGSKAAENNHEKTVLSTRRGRL